MKFFDQPLQVTTVDPDKYYYKTDKNIVYNVNADNQPILSDVINNYELIYRISVY